LKYAPPDHACDNAIAIVAEGRAIGMGLYAVAKAFELAYQDPCNLDAARASMFRSGPEELMRLLDKLPSQGKVFVHHYHMTAERSSLNGGRKAGTVRRLSLTHREYAKASHPLAQYAVTALSFHPHPLMEGRDACPDVGHAIYDHKTGGTLTYGTKKPFGRPFFGM